MTINKKYPVKTNDKKNSKTTDINNEKASTQLPSQIQKRNIFSTIDENFGFLNGILGNAIGLIEAKYDILESRAQCGVAYIESIVDKKLISSQIVEPLLNGKADTESYKGDTLTLIQSKFISIPKMEKTVEMAQVVEGLLYGETVIFINGINTALIVGSRKIEKRSIEKPENEVTVHASSESFTEDLNTNCSLVIKRLPTPDLRFEEYRAGLLSHTRVLLLWVEGIANIKAVEEARSRVKKIDIDNVDGIGTLAELIEDNTLSIFPKYRQTQRPDALVKALCDGHFGILCNNSPFAFFAPVTFWDNIKTMDDYAERSLVSSFLRFTRFMSFLIATVLSPLYLAFVTYNHTIVPPPLALNIAIGREGVPFPSVVELLAMTFVITIIREASLRIPGSVGFFVGTLAAVIIGQSAVTAGYVSASLIIVVAITAISSFAISTTTLIYPSRLINYFLILLAGVFGMFGVINGVSIVIWHAVSQESFSVPYLYPLVPFDFDAMKDTVIRAPFSTLNKRLRMLAPYNRTRMGTRGIINKNGKQKG